MRITFFKNEEHLRPPFWLISDNAEQIKVKNNETLRMVFRRIAGGLYIALFVWLAFLLRGNILTKAQGLLTIALGLIVCLPVHEFCHALGAVSLRKPIDGIRFFPYKKAYSRNKPAAYVKCAFCALSRAQSIFLKLAPLIFISFTSGICAILFPWLRYPMLYFALFNLATSGFDLADTIQILSVPQGAYGFDACWLKPIGDQPIIIHLIILSDDRTQILRKKYRFEGKRLIEEEPTSNAQVDAYVEEFREKFVL